MIKNLKLQKWFKKFIAIKKIKNIYLAIIQILQKIGINNNIKQLAIILLKIVISIFNKFNGIYKLIFYKNSIFNFIYNYS